MSEKELLYIDDTLSHLKQLEDFCKEYSNDLDNENFYNNLEEVIKKSKELFQKFYKLLEE